LRQAGNIHLHLDLIAGLPGEDLAGFAGSFDWVSRLAPHHLQLGFIKILPGSPMADLAVARKYCWQVEPPYEVLSSDAMNLADLLLLKRVATMLDWFGNSGLYAGSLAWLLPRWSGPFRFYADLADFARGEGALSRALNVSDRSRLLWRFARAQCPDLQGNAGLEQALLDLLRLDYRASGQKGQPAWLQDGSETERTAQVR
jgi:hypothetical protein